MFPDDDMGGVYYRVVADGIDARGANARLIAAAPDMYDALRSAVGAMEVLGHPKDYGALAKARAAIARAEPQP